MIFSTSEDIEAPFEHVFDRLTDFTAFERQALRRGADVRRTDSLRDFSKGASWEISFRFRGTKRLIRAEIQSIDAASGYVVRMLAQGFDGQTVVELVPLSRNRTRLGVKLEFKPQTLSARLLIQSLRLAKPRLTRNFKARVAEYAEDLEEKYRRG